ncbi:hypothetical protein GL4_1248 [Methyloceanibacter caenitepidi]|uniref:Uncharacterized protein n=1 Tax=Methyloceanibacter caenitepidi TaxID=1384459 RepID=A0A0A8K1L2_9HYPH|nr:hypothetical protein GL4_1248 [Methyloceanibacter caenitepidi]
MNLIEIYMETQPSCTGEVLKIGIEVSLEKSCVMYALLHSS